MQFVFKPKQQRMFSKKIYGFDIETYNNNKSFYCASIYNPDGSFDTFFDKDECIDHFRKKRFYKSIVCASNLKFDFAGLFFGKKEIKNFNMLWKSSKMLWAKTYIKNGNFQRKPYGNTMLTFLDTFNYSPLSVANLGKLLNLPKLEKPKFLGRKPANKAEATELITYNKRDAEISAKALQFFFKAFQKLGGDCCNTLASTAMSLYRNKYLDNSYMLHWPNELDDIFKGYYGGRTEAFARGGFKDYNYYDFNSLYPSVMINDFPDPNTKEISRENTDRYIHNFDGMSLVTVDCPYMDYPLLPYRYDNKLIFPIGKFRSWQSHVELRKAVDLGYRIIKIHRSYYYKDNCIPFHDYVRDLYALRMNYKNQNNPMEYVIKILLNSLYGKFGQKFRGRDNFIPLNHTVEELEQLGEFEIIGEYLRIINDSDPAPFCIPIWASYVTSYARLKLHEFILKSNPLYVDTDSLITRKDFGDSKALGKLKLEMKVSKGIIVKPKFYGLQTESESYVKAKGVGVKMVWDDLIKLLVTGQITYDKFMQWRESVRRGFIPNEIQSITKRLGLDDNKRSWGKDFNSNELQYSQPLKMENGLSVDILQDRGFTQLTNPQIEH